MKSTLLLAVTLCLSFHIAYADDVVHSKVNHKSNSASPIIDPDKHVFGINYGTSENEVITNFGNPDGTLTLETGETVMIYGTNVGLILRSKKICGAIVLPSGIINNQLAKNLVGGSVFDDMKFVYHWELTTGIKRDMALGQVKEILGKTLIKGQQKHIYSYETDTAEISFFFQRNVTIQLIIQEYWAS